MAERSSELEVIKMVDTGADDDGAVENSLQTRATDETPIDATDNGEEVAAEESSPEADQIREQIVETRRGMSETIDAIQEKLSFSNISEQVQTQVSEQITNVVETAKDALYGTTAEVLDSVSRGFKDFGGSDLVKKAQQNPTALAIIGAGVGALLVGFLSSGGSSKKRKKKSFSQRYEYDYGYASNRNNDDEVRYANDSRRELKTDRKTSNKFQESVSRGSNSKVGETSNSSYQAVTDAAGSTYAGITGAAGSAYESVGGAASKTYEGISSVAGKTYESVGDLAGKTYEAVGDAAGYTYDRAGDLGGQMKVNYNYYIEENPLAVGAVALAVGAAIGFAIPLTSKENEYLGEYRDSVLEKAQATAEEAIGSVKQMATDAQKAITDEVKSKTA